MYVHNYLYMYIIVVVNKSTYMYIVILLYTVIVPTLEVSATGSSVTQLDNTIISCTINNIIAPSNISVTWTSPVPNRLIDKMIAAIDGKEFSFLFIKNFTAEMYCYKNVYKA